MPRTLSNWRPFPPHWLLISAASSRYEENASGQGEEEAMTSAKAARRLSTQCEADLDRRYGKIGISALAAALRYQSAATNPANARTDQRLERQDAEIAD
jgi:hypothetical protein